MEQERRKEELRAKGYSEAAVAHALKVVGVYGLSLGLGLDLSLS